MTLLYGHDEATARMKRETMTPNCKVSISHNFYSENPEKHHEKKTKDKREKHAGGESIGMEHRQKKAIGASAKIRRHYKLKPAI